MFIITKMKKLQKQSHNDKPFHNFRLTTVEKFRSPDIEGNVY